MKQLNFPPALLTDLQEVDRVVLERASSRSSVVISAAGKYILSSGGKRLRAALALLAAQFGVYRLSDVLHAATSVELIHAASLVHDDLIDEAERRRGAVTVHTRWDHGVALMVGDYLFALAAGEMALAPDPRIITYFSQAVMTICEGELAPVMNVIPFATARNQYYYKIGCKTAALFAAACKAGMASGQGTQEQIDALGSFGYDLGLAFQIIDDILDFIGDEKLLGKPAGSDLRNGTITLPLIYAVAADDDATLAASIDSRDEDHLAWAIAEVQRLGIEPAYATARQHIDLALSHLDIFPDSPARQHLGEIAAFVLEREQ
ncbi:MAG: polyprenyl synthetase family protein [Chloroflexales bacterium]|nr:polyprenyl synthetase family protein [Chloroflexales bacterium]